MAELDSLLVAMLDELIQKGSGGGLDLASSVADYDPLVAFDTGDIARTPSGKYYRAIQAAPANGHSLDGGEVTYVNTYGSYSGSSTTEVTIPAAGLQLGDLLVILIMGSQVVRPEMIDTAQANGTWYLLKKVVDRRDLVNGVKITSTTSGIYGYLARQYRNARLAGYQLVGSTSSSNSKVVASGGDTGVSSKKHTELVMTASYGGLTVSNVAADGGAVAENVSSGNGLWAGDFKGKTASSFSSITFTYSSSNMPMVAEISLIPIDYSPDPVYWEELSLLSKLTNDAPKKRLLDSAILRTSIGAAQLQVTTSSANNVSSELQVTFVSPNSGVVSIDFRAQVGISSAADGDLQFMLLNDKGQIVPGTVRPITFYGRTLRYIELNFVIQDLTPGVTYTFNLGWRRSANTGYLQYGGYTQDNGTPCLYAWAVD